MVAVRGSNSTEDVSHTLQLDALVASIQGGPARVAAVQVLRLGPGFGFQGVQVLQLGHGFRLAPMPRCTRC